MLRSVVKMFDKFRWLLVSVLMLSGGAYALSIKAEIIKGQPVGGTEEINWNEKGEYVSGNSQDFPYVVSLEYLGINFCAGSIVRKNLILTAAHCFLSGNPDPTHLSVHAGRLATEGALSPHSQRFKIKRVIVPKYYNTSSTEDDLAIVRINDNFNFTKYVNKVRLPKLQQTLPNFTRKAVSLGWGVSDTGLPSRVLRKLNSTILTESECAKKFNYYNVKMVCAAGDNFGSACSGDSGGPLVIHDYENPNNDVLIGIHTATRVVVNIEALITEICDIGHYVAANVAYFKDWINENIKRIKDDNNHSFIERW